MNLKPLLVMGEGNKVSMQLRLGPYTATLPLPDHLASHTEEELQWFFNEVVPHMLKGLQDMQQSDNRKIRKKAQCVNKRSPQ